MQSFIVITLTLLSLAVSSAIPKPAEEHKNRVLDKDLSDETHFKNEEHNPEYDHEAFLGKDEARDFEDLSPEESKERLGKIYDKIDKDGDNKVSEEELRNWIRYVQNKYIMQDTERQWKEQDVDDKGKLTWVNYKKRTYGFLDDGDDEEHQYKEMMDRDERRWKLADEDKDNELSKEEFTNFLHPEEAEHMKDIIVIETLEDMDKDGDGLISEEEYIADMWPDSESEEPEWVKTEREQFSSFRDKDRDGRMGRDEIKEWIMPDDYDHSEAESKHLIFESDRDKDGLLTKEEVVNKYELFVGSQATDFGEALTRHDEF